MAASADDRFGMRNQEGPPIFVKWVYWLGVAAAVACFSINLAVSAIRGVNAQAAGLAILLLGIGITTLCVILWVGHITGIRPIQGRIAGAIWAVLIVSVLGTSAAAYKALLAPQHVRIDKFVLLDESAVSEDAQHHLSFARFTVRPNYDYAVAQDTGGNDITIAFGLIVSDFQRDSGSFNVDGEVTLSSTNGELLDKGDLPSATNDNYVKDRPIIQKLDPKDVERVLGRARGKVLFIQILRRFNQAVLDKGHKSLRVVIRDRKNSTWDEVTQPVVLR